MVSFNRNVANNQCFPIEPASRQDRWGANGSIHDFQRSDNLTISAAWDRLLAELGEVPPSTTSRIGGSYEVVCNQPDLPTSVISILNRFQLLIWMQETQAENPSTQSADGSHRIKESIQRDLIALRKMVRESSFQVRFSLRTRDLVEQLSAFFERLCD